MEGTKRAPDSASQPAEKLRVFISYSRAQVYFADEMELALKDKGHDVLIDRHGIAKGEDFQKRLKEMILACDTVVFILSDESAASDVCAWEVATAKTMSKRMLVVTLSKLSPGATPPSALAGIDWIHCWRNPAVPGSSQTKGFLELDAALRSNLDWLRHQTMLQEQAVRWHQRGATADSPHLLQSDLLYEALAWERAKPANEHVPEVVAHFIRESQMAEAESKSKAEAQIKALQTANADLERTNARLRKGRVLKAALSYEFSKKPMLVGSKWMEISFEHELATCSIRRHGRTLGSGFLISGHLLDPAWPSEPVIVTASHVIQHRNEIVEFEGFDFQLSLSDNPDIPYPVGSILFLSKSKLGVCVFSTSAILPSEIQPIQSVADSAFAVTLPKISERHADARDEPFSGDLTDYVVLAYAANQGRMPELLMMRLSGIDSDRKMGVNPRLIWMPSATEPGSSGAAVVDSQTGALIGVHMMGDPGLGAGCAWIGDIIDDIRQNPSAQMTD